MITIHTCPFCGREVYRENPEAENFDADVFEPTDFIAGTLQEAVAAATARIMEMRATLMEEVAAQHFRRHHRLRWFVYTMTGQLPHLPRIFTR